jgi:hypothetical protein
LEISLKNNISPQIGNKLAFTTYQATKGTDLEKIYFFSNQIKKAILELREIILINNQSERNSKRNQNFDDSSAHI